MPRRICCLLLFAIVGCKTEGRAYVECSSAGTGYNCTVTHQSGSLPLEACWSINVACRNGAHAAANTCRTVQPLAKVSHFVPVSAFSNAAQCDELAGLAVENVKLSER